MSFTQVSASYLGVAPKCKLCGAGSTISFNWSYAKETQRSEQRWAALHKLKDSFSWLTSKKEERSERDLSVFVRLRDLRYGALFECQICKQPWYLYGEPEFMNFIPQDRMGIIENWNNQPIAFSQEHLSELRDIGRTPPDIYGNGSQFDQTPCSVTTVSGEQIDLAVVSFQRHAPFEEWRHYRLASEIAQIRPSPYALPLSLRIASSNADEMRMGFAPTCIQAPDGRRLLLNWTQHFLVEAGFDAKTMTLGQWSFDYKNMPRVCNGPQNVVYFVADSL